MKTYLILAISHLAALAAGFAAGIYALPILIAPPAPSEQLIAETSAGSIYSAEFRRDLADSDALHWGEGRVAVGQDYIPFVGSLAPGPDYKLYLSPEFIETERDFEALRQSMVRVGDVKTFDNFLVAVEPGIDVSTFNTVIVWCESFGEFITAAQYR